MQHLLSPEYALIRLIYIKTNLAGGKSIPYGLCTEFSSEHDPWRLRDYMSQAGICWSKWPKFSGVIHYPVRIFEDTVRYTKEVNPRTLYDICGSRGYWCALTEYGRNRRELLDWLIEQFTLVIKNKELNNV